MEFTLLAKYFAIRLRNGWKMGLVRNGVAEEFLALMHYTNASLSCRPSSEAARCMSRSSHRA
jgi:hypothetical protein